MKIHGVNPETGEEYEAEAESIDEEFIESMSTYDLPEDKIKKMIDNLNVSADVKSLLFDFTKVTIRVGRFILKVGRKLIDIICKLYEEYPGATFGMLFGAIVGVLASSIPILGIVLGPIVAPIAIGFGLIFGVLDDIKDKNLARRIVKMNAKFDPLKA